MKCEDVRVLLAAYRRSEWTLEEQRAVNKHLAGCTECRRWEVDARGVGEHLRQLPTITPPASLRDRVFAAIREEQIAASTPAMHENAVMVTAAKKPEPISIASARSVTTQPVRTVRHVPPPIERVGEVAIGKMRAPRVLLGRNTAIATVAALFAIIFLIKAIPFGSTQLSPSPNGAACVTGCQTSPHTFKAASAYPTVMSALANGNQAVFVGKSPVGQEMLFVTDFSTKKPFPLLDAPTNNQITVVALTSKLLVWTVGNPESVKSNWTIYALPLTNSKVPAVVVQPLQIAAHNGYLQGDASAVGAVNALWAHGQSVMLVVTTQHVPSKLVRADLADDGALFTDTTITQATTDHAIVDPYLDDTTMFWVDRTTSANGAPHDVIWQQALQADAVAAAITSSDADAAGPVTDQQGIAWIQEISNPSPEQSVGDMAAPVLSVVTHQGSVDSLQVTSGNDTGITAKAISRADGYFFWVDANGAHLYRPGQNKADLPAILNGATILGLSPNAITWVMPNDLSTVAVLPLQ